MPERRCSALTRPRQRFQRLGRPERGPRTPETSSEHQRRAAEIVRRAADGAGGTQLQNHHPGVPEGACPPLAAAGFYTNTCSRSPATGGCSVRGSTDQKGELGPSGREAALPSPSLQAGHCCTPGIRPRSVDVPALPLRVCDSAPPSTPAALSALSVAVYSVYRAGV